MFGFKKKNELETEVESYHENKEAILINKASENSGEFLLSVEDVFSISKMGTVATGKISEGSVAVNDIVKIIDGHGNVIRTATVLKIELFGKTADAATVGDNAGLLLADVKSKEISSGYALVK